MSWKYLLKKSLLVLLLFGVICVLIISVILYDKNISLKASWKLKPALVNPLINSSSIFRITGRGVDMFLTRDFSTLKFKPEHFGSGSRSCIWNASIQTIHSPPVVSPSTANQIDQCKSILPFMKVTYEGNLVFENSTKVQNLTCCVHEIQIIKEIKSIKNVTTVARTTKPACTEVKVSETRNGNSVLLDEDFPHVSCQWNPEIGKKKSNELYLSNFQLTHDANLKTKFWRSLSKVADFKMPSSVFILGLSSISSNQVLTHLPSTHRFLTKNWFQRFTNYVKSGNGILENIYPILTGKLLDCCLTRVNRVSKSGCDTLRSKYDELKYVTFNGILDETYQNVFKQNPDFTVVPLIKSYENGMQNQSEMEDPNPCFQFNLLLEIFSYTSEFLENYGDQPYFGTLWLEPFSYQTEFVSLQLIDDLLSTFLQSNLHNLVNTVVILMSDGGFSQIGSTTANGILDNNFPAMFVRLPNPMPKHVHSTAHHGLISYKVLHATLLGNLNLACKGLVKESIVGHLNKSRPSVTKVCSEIEEKVKNTSATAIWDPMPNLKLTNCNLSGIFLHNCFCSAHPATEALKASNDVVENAAQFVVNSLNDFIDSSFPSEERVDCIHWVLEADGIVFNSTVVVTYPGDSMEIGFDDPALDTALFLVIRVQAFDVNENLGQVQTHFSSRIRLGPTQNHSSEMTLIDFPSRIHGRGEFPKKYSQCASYLHNHQLQSICYCKQPQANFGHVFDTPEY